MSVLYLPRTYVIRATRSQRAQSTISDLHKNKCFMIPLLSCFYLPLELVSSQCPAQCRCGQCFLVWSLSICEYHLGNTSVYLCCKDRRALVAITHYVYVAAHLCSAEPSFQIFFFPFFFRHSVASVRPLPRFFASSAHKHSAVMCNTCCIIRLVIFCLTEPDIVK